MIPEKPTDVSVGSIGADNIVLRWAYDNTQNNEPPLYYKITYLPVGGVATTATAEYQEGQLEYSITLNTLKPSTLYEISISAKTSYFTSDSLNLLLHTAEGDNVMIFSIKSETNKSLLYNGQQWL